MPLENLIRFPALGDWGGTEYASYYVPLQEWNAQLMDDLCAEDSCDFVVSVGDNFYETGVKNIGLLHSNSINSFEPKAFDGYKTRESDRAIVREWSIVNHQLYY